MGNGMELDYDAIRAKTDEKWNEEAAIIELFKKANANNIVPDILKNKGYEELYTIFGRVLNRVRKSRNEMRVLLDSVWPEQGLVNADVEVKQMVAKKNDGRIKKWVKELLDEGTKLTDNSSKLEYVNLIIEKHHFAKRDDSINLVKFVEDNK